MSSVQVRLTQSPRRLTNENNFWRRRLRTNKSSELRSMVVQFGAPYVNHYATAQNGLNHAFYGIKANGNAITRPESHTEKVRGEPTSAASSPFILFAPQRLDGIRVGRFPGLSADNQQGKQQSYSARERENPPRNIGADRIALQIFIHHVPGKWA